MIKLKQEIDESTLAFGDFNVPLSVMDGSNRQNTNRHS